MSKPLKASGFETSCCGWDEVAARLCEGLTKIEQYKAVQPPQS